MRSLVAAALEARAPTWAEESPDPRPRCTECDALLTVKATGRPRQICRRVECKRSSWNRWNAARPRLGILRPLGRAIAREIAAQLGMGLP